MKILMLAPQPFFEPRGTPISVYQRLTALSQLGHQVDLVTYHLGQSPEIPHITIHRSPPLPFIKQIKIGPSWLKPLLDLLLFLKAFALLLRNRYDVIHSHEEAAFMALLLAPLFRTAHLYDMHSSLPKQLESYGVGNWWPLKNIFAWLERVVINSATAVITIDRTLEQLVRAINPQANHLRIENVSVDAGSHDDALSAALTVNEIRDMHRLHDITTVVYTGSFEKYQGLEMLLHSIPLVRRVYPHVCYILVGGKADQIHHLQDLATQLGVAGYVRFPGIVPPAAALSYLEAADILISARLEGTSVPLKAYSYLHAGKPIVATNLTTHTQVFNNQLSLLVDPTAAALADGVIELIADPEKRSRLGSRAKLHALEFYSRENYVARMDEIYKTLQRLPSLSKKQLVEN